MDRATSLRKCRGQAGYASRSVGHRLQEAGESGRLRRANGRGRVNDRVRGLSDLRANDANDLDGDCVRPSECDCAHVLQRSGGRACENDRHHENAREFQDGHAHAIRGGNLHESVREPRHGCEYERRRESECESPRDCASDRGRRDDGGDANDRSHVNDCERECRGLVSRPELREGGARAD